MRIFLSYAAEDKATAEAIAFSLRARGYYVFLDRDDLPEGASFDDKIAAAVDRSDVMIFLISPHSVAQGRYTLTELRYARYKWRSPSNRVVPVMIEPTPMSEVPSYLKAVSILEPQGNKAAEVTFAIERLRGNARALQVAFSVAAAGAVLALVAGFLPVAGGQERWSLFQHGLMQVLAQSFVGLVLAAFLSTIYWQFGDRKWWKLAVITAGCLAGWFASVQSFSSAPVGQFIDVPYIDFTKVTSALTAEQRKELGKSIESVDRFLKNWNSFAGGLGVTAIFSGLGLLLYVTIFLAFATVERSFRSINRLALGAFPALLAGGLGYFVSTFTRLNDFTTKYVFWYFEAVDLLFALIYLPWLMTVPALFSYWLVRGQDR